MNIKPISVSLKNFLSYKELDFKFNDDTFFITGDNGTGKTTIMESLIYLFTGRTLKGEKGDDVINDNETSCKITFKFYVNDKIGYIICSRNPNKIIFNNSKELIRKHSISEMYKSIQDFFGFDFELLTKFFFVGESEKQKFSFLSSDDKEKKDLLTKLVKAEIIDIAYEENSKKEKYFYELLIKKNSLLKSLISINENLTNKISSNENEIKIINSKNHNNKILISESFLMKELSIAENNKTLLFDIKNSITRMKDRISNRKDNIHKLELKKANIKICPKCGYQLNDKINIDELEKEIKKENFLWNGLQKALLSLRNEESKHDLEDIENKIEDYELKLKTINEIKRSQSIEINSIQAIIDDSKIQRDENKKKIKDLENVIIVLNKKYDIVKKYKFWFGKEGFKNYLFSKKLKLIQQTTNDILLETGTNLSVELSGLNKLKSGNYNQKISGKILIGNKIQRNYISLSKGQKRRVDLAFILAFGKLLSFKNNFQLRMFDEPFSGLDKLGKEKVISMLKNLSMPCYIISPEKELSIHFDNKNVFNVKQKSNNSVIY